MFLTKFILQMPAIISVLQQHNHSTINPFKIEIMLEYEAKVCNCLRKRRKKQSLALQLYYKLFKHANDKNKVKRITNMQLLWYITNTTGFKCQWGEVPIMCKQWNQACEWELAHSTEQTCFETSNNEDSMQYDQYLKCNNLFQCIIPNNLLHTTRIILWRWALKTINIKYFDNTFCSPHPSNYKIKSTNVTINNLFHLTKAMHNTRMICIWTHISKNIPFRFKHHVLCIFKASITSYTWPIQNKEGTCTFCQQVYVCKNIRTFILRKFFKVFLDHNICYLRMLLHLYIYFSNNKVIILFVCEKLCTNKTESVLDEY